MRINEMESHVNRETRRTRESKMIPVRLKKEAEGILTVTTPNGIKLHINHIPSVNWLTDVMLTLSKRSYGVHERT